MLWVRCDPVFTNKEDVEGLSDFPRIFLSILIMQPNNIQKIGDGIERHL